MLKRIPAGRAQQLVAAASSSPTCDPRVTYPSWYLHRWHFLPEGYLSRRGAAAYEHIIRRLYSQGADGQVVRAAVTEIERLRPGSLLEVGCGPGFLLEETARRAGLENVVGLDLSPYMLERARARLRESSVRLVHGDGLRLPSESGAFDLVVASHYVGHLPTAVRAPAAAELARVLRPGGHLVVVDHRWHPWPRTEGIRPLRQRNLNGGIIQLTTFIRLDPALGSGRG